MTDAGKALVASLLSLPDPKLMDVFQEVVRQARLSGRTLFGGPPAPSSDAIASALQLEELRVGQHYYRDADGDYLRNLDLCRVGQFSVPRDWRVEVMPSFRNHWVLAGVTAVGTESGGFQTRDWTKAVFATGSDVAVKTINDDPVAHAIQALDLAELFDNLVLDGTSYSVTLETDVVRATFSFSNPMEGTFFALEREILKLAVAIAEHAAKEVLRQSR